MPLYMLIRSSKKGRAKETKGLRDYMRSKRVQANPAAPAGAIPCYTVEAPQEFDEEGRELGQDAQVWKTYVKEADQVDEELVDGWNKSMDVILIFAALFSAISTTFVIESYKNLKQDPADVSSETLIAISKTLTFIANGSQPATVPLTSEPESPEFKASAKAICVNVLWFLSLSLSVAVSLISMLAKEWCLEFMAGRTGPPGAQARRRQQRWDGLVGWKMKEVIVILPSLIHLSLLLFAIGLCVFLWDVHFGVAIPVVMVTTMAVGAYFTCTILPFLYNYCPYGTVLSRLYKQFLTAHSQTVQDDAKQDEVTAKALHWMITNCETPRSVDVALQSLAAADENLPPDMLERCYAWTLAKRRLESVDPNERPEHNRITSRLYERALNSLPTVAKQNGRLGYARDGGHGRLQQKVLMVQSCINGLIYQLSLGSLDRKATNILKRCTQIGPNFLSKRALTLQLPRELEPVKRRSSTKPETEMDPMNLVDEIEQYLGQYLTDIDHIDPALCSTLAAILAFVLCCNVAQGFTRPVTSIEFYLRLNRAMTLAIYKDDYRGLGTLLISSSVSYNQLADSNITSSSSTPNISMEAALEALWGSLMMAVYSDRSALVNLDSAFLVHGILHVLANPRQYRLSCGKSRELSNALGDLRKDYGLSTKVQHSHHARYIQDITKNLAAACNDVYMFRPQFINGLITLVTFSPWDDSYLLPTPEIYIFSVEAVRWAGQFSSKAFGIFASSPFPKHSPQIARLLPHSNLISVLTHLRGAGGDDERGFALAQLWLWFHMPLQSADRGDVSPNALEPTLIQHLGLENRLDKHIEAMDEFETGLIMLLNQYTKSHRSDIIYYLYRVLELMLQWKCAPLPEFACKILDRVPDRLRGLGAFVNLEAEKSVAYPGVEFDS